MKMFRKPWLWAAVLPAGLLLMIVLLTGEMSAFGPDPTGRAAFSSSTNCLTSLDNEAGRHIEPLPYAGSPEQTRERLREVLEAFPRSTIRVFNDIYVHAEFASRIFRFVDDAEFYFDDAAGVIQVRSAARSGYYDFGANRRRMETIRQAMLRKPSR